MEGEHVSMRVQKRQQMSACDLDREGLLVPSHTENDPSGTCGNIKHCGQLKHA